MEEDINDFITHAQLLNQKLALFPILVFSSVNAVLGFASQNTASVTLATVTSSSIDLGFSYFILRQ